MNSHTNLIEKNRFRGDFPALTQKIRGKSLVYLDSAASALKPWPVIERISHFYSYETANVHRGAHYLADMATLAFEGARQKVVDFLGASGTEEIIFTAGTTASLNLVATSLGELLISAGDEILITEMEHHANLVPWQMLAQRKNAKLVVVEVDPSGQLDMSDFEKKLSSRTKILSVTHCSNTLGTINDIQAITQKAHQAGAVVVADGAQAVATMPVNVQELGVDFYAFSAHKLFGPYGVGVLFGKREWLQKMPPYQGGGSMISTVTFEKTTYNDLPYKFEAGTPHIEGVLGLGRAIEYIQKIGYGQIQSVEKQLLHYAMPRLQEIAGVKVIGQAQHRAPLISFSIEGLHHSDVAQILDQEAVAVRAGHHCTMPLLKKFGISGTVRASFSLFNDQKDIDTLILALHKAKEMLS